MDRAPHPITSGKDSLQLGQTIQQQTRDNNAADARTATGARSQVLFTIPTFRTAAPYTLARPALPGAKVLIHLLELNPPPTKPTIMPSDLDTNSAVEHSNLARSQSRLQQQGNLKLFIEAVQSSPCEFCDVIHSWLLPPTVLGLF